MGTISPSKTANVSLLSMQGISSNSVVKSSAQDVSNVLAAAIYCWLGRDDTGGALTAGVTISIQGSPKTSGDDTWSNLAVFESLVTVPESEAVSGTENAGATVIEVASTSNLAVGQLVFIKNSTLANSEFGQIIAVSTNTSITLLDGITNAQTGSTIYNQAERFVASIDISAIMRIRVVYDASNTGRSVVGYALMSRLDNMVTA